MIQKIYLVFAVVVAFGVVYNNARISLAERARELATQAHTIPWEILTSIGARVPRIYKHFRSLM